MEKVPSVAEHPHLLSALWPSTIHHIRKAGWWGLRTALVCGYRDMNLEGSLILYPLSRIRGVVYSRVLWTPQPWVLGQIHSTRYAFPLVKRALSPARTWLVTLYHHVTVILMGMSVVHRVHSWIRLWIRLFSPPTTRHYWGEELHTWQWNFYLVTHDF